MLECFLRQKVDLECDGPFNLGSEGYNVTSNADKLGHICSKGDLLSHYVPENDIKQSDIKKFTSVPNKIFPT